MTVIILSFFNIGHKLYNTMFGLTPCMVTIYMVLKSREFAEEFLLSFLFANDNKNSSANPFFDPKIHCLPLP
jgi:hypothetical protein